MGAWRMRPPEVKQPSLLKCWAAAISSWTRVTVGVPDLDVDETVDLFKRRGVVGLLGGMKRESGPKAIAAEFSLEVETVEGGGLLSLGYLGPKLKKSHVLVVLRAPGALASHMVVVYGVDQLAVCFMDPRDGKNVTHSTNPLLGGDLGERFTVLWRA